MGSTLKIISEAKGSLPCAWQHKLPSPYFQVSVMKRKCVSDQKSKVLDHRCLYYYAIKKIVLGWWLRKKADI